MRDKVDQVEIQGASVRVIPSVTATHSVQRIRWARSDSPVQDPPHLPNHMFIRLPRPPFPHSHTDRVYVFSPRPLPVLHLALNEAASA